MTTLSTITLLIVLLLAALIGVFVVMGPDRVWRLFGEADLGAVDFEHLQRRSNPNDALACPPDYCQASSDIVSHTYPIRAAELRRAFSGVMKREPRTVQVDADDVTLTDRYVQRSHLMGFPDTVNVRFIAIDPEHSTLALYSRSQLGRSDLGANLQRIRRLLDALDDAVATAELPTRTQ